MRLSMRPLFLPAIFLVATASAQVSSFKSLKFKLSGDEVKEIPDNSYFKTVPGRLIISRDGQMVFRSQSVSADIPVVSPDAKNPFQANTQSLFRKDTNTRELIGTLPVSAKLVKGTTGSIDLSSNVSNVWNQIKSKFKNPAVADQLKRSVSAYEVSTVGTLSESTKGWTSASPEATPQQTPESKPEALTKLQDQIAQVITSPSTDLGKDDFALAATLLTSSDPDQLFGSYGPISVNWTLDDLKRFVHAMGSVAAINYFGEIKGSGFLIGDGLLLTCEHVLDLVDLKNATATFPAVDDKHAPITLSFEENPVLRSSTLQITSKLSNRNLRCDFALLKLKDSKHLADEGIGALEISKGNLLNAAVAVVGYPETFKKLTIHDNGIMLFPYVLPRKDFNAILTQRVTRYLYTTGGSKAMDEATFKVQLKTSEDLFRKAYDYRDSDAAGTIYFYVGRQDEWKDVPSFGVDASTTHGDSGGPVFDKSTLRIIGILRGGKEGSFATGSWFNHDKIIPISEAIDSITQADPTLLTTYNVNVSQ